MSNAIGLNSQTVLSIDAPQIVPVTPVSATHSCDGECPKQGGGFSELLDAELNGLADSEPLEFQVLENTGEVDDSTVQNIPSPVLASLLQQEQASDKLLNLVEVSGIKSLTTDAQKLEAEFSQALLELPEEITSLPLTAENKSIIEQQALAIVQQKSPELIAQMQKEDGQALSLEGKVLPLIEEALVKQNALKTIPDTSLVADKFSGKGLGAQAQVQAQLEAEKSPLELLAENDSDAELDDDFKNVSPSETTPQKFSTEALSTSINNVLGANQASVNTPTAATVQSGSTLLLPQNPTPEQWGSALSDKVQVMINAKLDSADLRIDPPHLGKMDVSIKVTDAGTTVVIQTQHAATRDLVDAASHRLKEMLEEAGHENVDVDVSHKENNESENQFADNDDFNEQESALNNGTQENEDVNDSDVIAASYNTNDRPTLDLFA